MNQACLRRGIMSAGAVVAMLIAVPPVLLAQPAPPPPQTTTNPPSPQSEADKRIQDLRAQLHITEAQLPQWNAFAQAMRTNATSTDTLFRQRAGAAASMNALDNMKSYAQVARTYADNTQALATAFEGLYDVLTPQQKQTVDTLFRQDAQRIAAQQQARHP
jgi:periplasmic protein CpxP/Spy